MPKLNARSLKVTVVLTPAEVTDLHPPAAPRVLLQILVPDFGTATADIATKSLRKAQATIAEHGADGVAVIVQGRLTSGGNIVEAGLVAQAKAPKPVMAEA